jgi:hypothetical protein
VCNDYCFTAPKGHGQDSGDQTGQAEAVAAFHSRIETLRKEGIYKDYLDDRLPWAKATASDKLEEIVMAAQYASPNDRPTVPGAETLQVITREVDETGLAAIERDMLRDVRTRIEAGQLDGPHPKHNMDRAWMALREIVAVDEFEWRLEAHKEGDRWWDWLPEDRKAGMIVEIGLESGAPGTHALAAIEREVDYDRLSPWRREAMQELRSQLDKGELDGEDPNPVYRGDRVNTALRLAQLQARVEDYKQLGGEDRRGVLRRWQELSEGEKFDRIMDEVVGLDLGSEARVYDIVMREVDMTRAPEERRQAFEDGRKEAWPRPEEAIRRERLPSPGELAKSDPISPQPENPRQGRRQGVGV